MDGDKHNPKSGYQKINNATYKIPVDATQPLTASDEEMHAVRQYTALPSFLHRIDMKMSVLYRFLARTWLGKILTSYRHISSSVISDPSSADMSSFRPLSDRRKRVAQAMEQSKLLKVFRIFFVAMSNCPAILFGMFFSIYGLAGIAVESFVSRFVAGIDFHPENIYQFAYVILCAVPFIFSKKSIAGVLGASAVGRAIICKFLGIPEERLHQEKAEFPPALLYIVPLLAFLCSGATVWIQPLAIPACIGGIGIIGLVLCHPETGVVLSSLILPFMWYSDTAVHAAIGLILLTWCGYGIQVLSLHRSMHMDRLDGFIMVFGGIMLLQTMFGLGNVKTCLIWTVLLSHYWLTVNVMKSRESVRQCLGGVVLSVLLAIVIGAARPVPDDFYLWISGDWLREILSLRLTEITVWMNTQPYEPMTVFVTLAFPWLFAFAFNSRRPLTLMWWLTVSVCGILMLALYGKPSQLICIAICLLLFCIMYSRHTVTVGLFVAPVLTVGGIAVIRFLPVRSWIFTQWGAWLERMADRVHVWRDVWQMILKKPAGIGPGVRTFGTAFYTYTHQLPTLFAAQNACLDLLAAFGWPGLICSMCILFLFWQKGLTALTLCRSAKDRAWIAAGLTVAADIGIYGCTHSLYMDDSLFFAITVMLGLSSAYQSFVLKEDIAWMPDSTVEAKRRQECVMDVRM